MIVAIGMDPGPTPGIVRLTYSTDGDLLMVDVVQCTAHTALDLLEVLLRVTVGTEVYFQVEKFVHNTKGGSGAAGRITRDMVGSAITMVQTGRNAWVNQRSAHDTKDWATDARLEAAGLLPYVKGMTHAKDAARHALFTAVAEGMILDPLSRKAKRYV
jgi:hypothetical protein